MRTSQAMASHSGSDPSMVGGNHALLVPKDELLARVDGCDPEQPDL